MIIEGRTIYKGNVEGHIIKCDEAISFLGGVDPITSKINTGLCKDREIKDSIFVFDRGKGSTVGSYVIYSLKYYNVAPKAMICRKIDEIVATGSVMSDIPTLDMIDIDIFADNDYVKINDNKVEINIEPVEVVTGILKYKDHILILKRSDKVKTNKNKWAGVSGYIEPNDEPLSRSLIEIEEETGLKKEHLKLLKQGNFIYTRDHETLWKIYTFLWEIDTDTIKIDWEHTEYKWISVSELDLFDTVPKLKEVIQSLLK